MTAERTQSVEHYIKFYPAWDKRTDNPKTNYGIHGVEMGFHIKGELGAVQFVLGTNWHLPHVQQEMLHATLSRPTDSIELECRFLPMPVDLGYHSPTPRYEDQHLMTDCPILGGDCYYDGSWLDAKAVYDLLVEQGSDAVWDFLFNYYRKVFGKLQ